MPLRLRLCPCHSTLSDLPILPFLAPRIFTPWPSWPPRRLASTQARGHGDKRELVPQPSRRAYRTSSESPTGKGPRRRAATIDPLGISQLHDEEQSRLADLEFLAKVATSVAVGETVAQGEETRHLRDAHSKPHDAYNDQTEEDIEHSAQLETLCHDRAHAQPRKGNIRDEHRHMDLETDNEILKISDQASLDFLLRQTSKESHATQSGLGTIRNLSRMSAAEPHVGHHVRHSVVDAQPGFGDDSRIVHTQSEKRRSNSILKPDGHRSPAIRRHPGSLAPSTMTPKPDRRARGIMSRDRHMFSVAGNREWVFKASNLHLALGDGPASEVKWEKRLAFMLHRHTFEAAQRGSNTRPKCGKRSSTLLETRRPTRMEIEADDIWNEVFFIINIRSDPRLRDRPWSRKDGIRIWPPLFTVHWMRNQWETPEARQCRKLIACPDVPALKSAWTTFSQRYKFPSRVWMRITLWILRFSPNHALKFILGTQDTPEVPRYWFGDCLEYITSFYCQDTNTDIARQRRDANYAALLAAVIQILSHSKDGRIILTSKTIHLLLESAMSAKDRSSLYQFLLSSGHDLHRNTSLQFAKHFAKDGQTLEALEILSTLHNKGLNLNQPSVESVCTTILHGRFRPVDSKLSDSAIFAHLLDMGIQPNAIHYNTLLHNTIQRGDVVTAKRMVDMMEEIGSKPDEHSCSVLLNDAKKRGDLATVEKMWQMVSDWSLISKHVITDLLHSIAITEPPERVVNDHLQMRFKTLAPCFKMLCLYQQHFDTTALEALLPPEMQAFKEVVRPPSTPQAVPELPSLVVMLSAVIRRQLSIEPLLALYNRFQQLLRERHPAILPASTTTHIYDAFIMAFAAHESVLVHAPRVVSDMLELAKHQMKQLRDPYSSGSISAAGLTATTNHASAFHCTPSIYTWSILLKAFMDHEQPLSAEKVISIMDARGIIPNQVTWNILITGYAKLQDVLGLVGSVRRLESAGFAIDEVGTKALGRIENRSMLMDAIETMKAKANVADTSHKITDAGTAKLMAAYRQVVPASLSEVKAFRKSAPELAMMSVESKWQPTLIDANAIFPPSSPISLA